MRLFRLREDPRGGDWAVNTSRFKAVRCGRRWGKSLYGETWQADGAIKGFPCGWFAPDYKRMIEVYNDLKVMLKPVIDTSSKTDGVIRLITGGRIDFWTLEDEDAGRSRMYKRAFIDEGAFTKPNMLSIWDKSIKPTLLDYTGSAIVASNTNGKDPENFLYAVCNDPKHGFIEFHAPSWANPTVPKRRTASMLSHNGGPPIYTETLEEWQARQTAEYDAIRAKTHPLVFAQEYAAEFVDWSGVAFFGKDKLLVNGAGVEVPTICDSVFAIVDSATKTGSANDGTAVGFFAYNKYVPNHPLIVLDWDIIQIEGDLLADWLPSVFVRLEEWARRCRPRAGIAGTFIEDKDSGQVLIQHARNRGWPAQAIESGLTALGKDGRALSVSGYVYTEKVKFTHEAYDKVTDYKGITRNHMMEQVTNFRIGDKDAAKRADDLLDVFTYGIAMSLGNEEGF